MYRHYTFIANKEVCKVNNQPIKILDSLGYGQNNSNEKHHEDTGIMYLPRILSRKGEGVVRDVIATGR